MEIDRVCPSTVNGASQPKVIAPSVGDVYVTTCRRRRSTAAPVSRAPELGERPEGRRVADLDDPHVVGAARRDEVERLRQPTREDTLGIVRRASRTARCDHSAT